LLRRGKRTADGVAARNERYSMKISVDVDVSPEELRRFFGLPDLGPAQDLIVKRITAQVEKGLDSNLVPAVMRSIIAGGVQSWEAYQKLVTGMLSGATRLSEGAKRSSDEPGAD
jgi:hypothetical protein